jgi:hypothetical protein
MWGHLHILSSGSENISTGLKKMFIAIIACDPTDLELFGKQIIEKLRPEFNIVNTEHTKGATHRNFRALLKEDDKLTRQIQEVESVLKRTHRL